ncbi:MAG: class I SAM-dependent rRNA methyltransferase [Candidatus Hydrogenedentes bacterium]|nr:class I SAM-dependent rRNA methyltransferase [Candidatus Hydrogenedentota bacterium]
MALLKPNEERRLLRGHLWAYRNEFQVLPPCADGAVFDIFSSSKRFVARAFFQQEGGIAGRVISRHQRSVDESFFRNKLEGAKRLRARLFPNAAVYRWVHGESDGMPGLVIDRYDRVAVVQSSCFFYKRYREQLARLLLQEEGIRSLLFLDGDSVESRGEACAETLLSIDGVSARLSLERPQKTGLFLDQRENWPLIRRFAKDKRVLDGYCHHGFWGIHAAQAGAAEVIGVDSSPAAVAQANGNAELNAVQESCRFIQMQMEAMLQGDETFDVIVLDPPAFAKTRRQGSRAMGRYEDINRRALKALRPDGILFTCSCSHFLPRDRFLEVIKRSARSSGRKVQLLALRGASPDHPVLPMMPETEYLKCAILRVD